MGFRDLVRERGFQNTSEASEGSSYSLSCFPSIKFRATVRFHSSHELMTHEPLRVLEWREFEPC